MDNRIMDYYNIEEYRTHADEYWKFKSQEAKGKELQDIKNDIEKAADKGYAISYKFKFPNPNTAKDNIGSLEKIAIKHMSARIIEAIESGYDVREISNATNEFDITYKFYVAKNDKMPKDVCDERQLLEAEKGLINGFKNVINDRHLVKTVLKDFKKAS